VWYVKFRCFLMNKTLGSYETENRTLASGSSGSERCRSTRGELCRLFILGAAAARSILACCFGFGRTPRRTAEFTDMLHSLT
jgi:hypothetical protein